MKKTAILIAALLVARVGASADTRQDVLEIKKLYAETAAAIVRAGESEVAGLYGNELTINNRNGSWRAVGKYAKKAAFWYSDQPEYAAVEGRAAEAALVKVEVNETAAAVHYYREFFFAAGKLCFFFRSENSGAGPMAEERIYFKDDLVLMRLLGPNEASLAISIEPILAEARYWQKLFLLSFAN